jgi:hypothetical protein
MLSIDKSASSPSTGMVTYHIESQIAHLGVPQADRIGRADLRSACGAGRYQACS